MTVQKVAEDLILNSVWESNMMLKTEIVSKKVNMQTCFVIVLFKHTPVLILFHRIISEIYNII